MPASRSSSHAKPAFPCTWPACGKTLGSMSALNRHSKTHSQRIIYECGIPECSEPFKDKYSRSRYDFEQHGDLDRCHCPVGGCGFSTKRSYELVRHMKKKHHNLEQPERSHEKSDYSTFHISSIKDPPYETPQLSTPQWVNPLAPFAALATTESVPSHEVLTAEMFLQFMHEATLQSETGVSSSLQPSTGSAADGAVECQPFPFHLQPMYPHHQFDWNPLAHRSTVSHQISPESAPSCASSSQSSTSSPLSVAASGIPPFAFDDHKGMMTAPWGYECSSSYPPSQVTAVPSFEQYDYASTVSPASMFGSSSASPFTPSSSSPVSDNSVGMSMRPQEYSNIVPPVQALAVPAKVKVAPPKSNRSISASSQSPSPTSSVSPISVASPATDNDMGVMTNQQGLLGSHPPTANEFTARVYYDAAVPKAVFFKEKSGRSTKIISRNRSELNMALLSFQV